MPIRDRKLVGRPRLPESARRQVSEARRLGARYLRRALALWVGVLNDPKADMQHRLTAARELCDRFGLPRRTEIDADGTGSADLVAMRGIMLESMREILNETRDEAIQPVVADYVVKPPGENGAGSGAH